MNKNQNKVMKPQTVKGRGKPGKAVPVFVYPLYFDKLKMQHENDWTQTENAVKQNVV